MTNNNKNNNKINRRRKNRKKPEDQKQISVNPTFLERRRMNVQFQPNSSLKILKKSKKFNMEILHLKSRTIFFESHGCDPREDLLHPPVRNPDQFNYKDSFFAISKKPFRKGANSTFPQFVKIHLLQCFRRT